MTSLFMQESILVSKELGTKVHVAYPDARQAFDRVWHQGLLAKLYGSIDSNTFMSFVSLHQGVLNYKGKW